ncbi:MAG: magnesium/cobalt transporter CorA [Verrucomicrobiales bacterium]|nr:magnesium/cobalt transporter CorA [Verrucomicrobiales bacterium]
MPFNALNLIPGLRHRRDPRAPAASPGTLVHVGERRVDHVRMRVIDYSHEGVREFDATEAAECVAFEGRDSPAWIMVTGLHETEKIGQLLEAYEIHPLIQEDILNTQHQPKVDDFNEYLFVAARLVSVVDGPQQFDIQQFSMLITRRVLISFHEAPSPIFDPILARLKDGKGRLRSSGPDYLAWALLDAILDHYLLALDSLEDEAARIDESLSREVHGSVTMREIHSLRSKVNYLYRTVRPIREVAIGLQRSESPLLSSQLQPFIRDLYDHAWHAIETADHLRESVVSIREFYQANLAQRMNEVMKVLTAISTVFLPLSFLAGVYGMNFEHMPELGTVWAYPAIWCVFIGVAFGMLWWFKRKNWL